jgi:hypothetical protein
MYTAEISRKNPSCFLFLIDQSGSMSDPFGGEGGGAKSQSVADALNRLLLNLVLRCTRADGVRPYYEIGVIGYGSGVDFAFSGPLAQRKLVPINEVADNPARVDERKRKIPDGAGGLVEEAFKLPIWFEPIAQGGTPMCEAFRLAHTVLAEWSRNHPAAYPPIVINLTDGEATDGDASGPADTLKQLTTSDGNVLVFNCHMSSQQGTPVLFPDNGTGLPDNYARLLFSMSSVLPDAISKAAKSEGFQVSAQSCGFAFNADLADVIRFLDIGTRLTNLR